MINHQNFTLTGAAGKSIQGDITIDNDQSPLANIIFIHGFKGFKDWGAHNLTSDWFAAKQYRYIKFNLSHSGASADDITDLETFGANTFSKELQDIDAVMNYVTEHFPQQENILIGHSRGGALAILQAAKDNRIHKLITWASIIDFRKLWKEEVEQQWQTDGVIYIENARTKQRMPLNLTLLQDYLNNKAALNIRSAAQQVNVPWLIVHGIDDPGVPVSIADELAAIQPDAQLIKIEGADHVFNARHPYNAQYLPEKLLEVCIITLAFIEENGK